MSARKWFRVVDPLSPLFGCDVTVIGSTLKGFKHVMSMRRMDIFVGDRPFQLIAPEGESLGILIKESHLEESPLQVDVIEIGSSRPFGICLDESEMQRGDDLVLHIVNYEQATQIALKDGDGGELLATQTFTDKSVADAVLKMFERGDDRDDITFMLKRN